MNEEENRKIEEDKPALEPGNSLPQINAKQIEEWANMAIASMELKPVLAVPVDYSDALLCIPKNHEVIYSTVVLHNNNAYSGSGLIGASAAIAMNASAKYKTHALMTPCGIGGDIIDKRKVYIPWFAIANVKGDKIYLSGTRFLSLKRDDALESNDEFKKRQKVFPVVIVPYVISSKRGFLQTPRGQALEGRQRNSFIKNMNGMVKDCNKRAEKLGLSIPRLEFWTDA